MIYYFNDDSLVEFNAENKEMQMLRLRNQEEGRQRCKRNVCIVRRAYVLRCPNGARTELLVCLHCHSQNLLPNTHIYIQSHLFTGNGRCG